MQIRNLTKTKLNKIDIVILCGGIGSRLSTIVNDRPKPIGRKRDAHIIGQSNGEPPDPCHPDGKAVYKPEDKPLSRPRAVQGEPKRDERHPDHGRQGCAGDTDPEQQGGQACQCYSLQHFHGLFLLPILLWSRFMGTTFSYHALMDRNTTAGYPVLHN